MKKYHKIYREYILAKLKNDKEKIKEITDKYYFDRGEYAVQYRNIVYFLNFEDIDKNIRNIKRDAKNMNRQDLEYYIERYSDNLDFAQEYRPLVSDYDNECLMLAK